MPVILRRVVHACVLLSAGLAVSTALAQGQPPPLPPPPVPPQNPITEPKRILGKILYWEEQLSSTSTVACASCHSLVRSGTDARLAVNPGTDGLAPSADDVIGSPGVPHIDANGVPVDDPVFGFDPQITRRSANAVIGSAYAPNMFWDGRATSDFTDPETGLISIPAGGALESQAIRPIVSSVEMGYEGRTWADVRHKLERSLPLQDATDLPGDVSVALTGSPSYGDLFQAAFGDPQVTGERIALAVATYERTLIPNQTPWDLFIAGNPTAMTPGQTAGWNFFRGSPCAAACHTPPVFSNQTFRNIGIRPPAEDTGRQEVTGLAGDRGRFKVPTLRNVGLKLTHMHTGRFTNDTPPLSTVQDAVLWYRPGNPDRSPDNLDPALPVGVPPNVLPALVDFLTNALTDPRVAAGTAPFDQPTLHGGQLPVLAFDPDDVTMTWPPLAGAQRYNVYRGDVANLSITRPDGLPAAGYGACLSVADPNPSDTAMADAENPRPGQAYFYLKSVVDATGAERGLGATSEGRARYVVSTCPPPGL